MRKTLQFLSAGFLAVLLLASCSAGGGLPGNTGANSTPGGYGASTQTAPAAVNTQNSQIPQTGGSAAASPTAPPAAAPAATNTPVVSQPPAAAPATAVPPTAVVPTVIPPTAAAPTAVAPTAAPPAALATATPLAALPAVPAAGTGSSVCGENRLNELDGIDIFNKSGLKIGDAKGIVVLRDSRTINNLAGAADAAPPQITYLATELNTAMQKDRPLAIPYKAFSALPASIPGGDCGLVLNVPDNVLAQAPMMDMQMMNFTMPNWDQQLNAFWAANGFAVPAAGGQMGSPVFLDDHVDNFQVLGMNNMILGEVKDIIIDPQTGSLLYGVLKTEDNLILGKRYIPIPFSRLVWTPTGLAVGNISLESLRNAPAFMDSDQLDMLPQNWDANVKTFWASLK